jgi:hypothetical protein
VAFIKGMKAIIQRNRRKSGVQKGDESHYSEEPREKWCSKRRWKPLFRVTEGKVEFKKKMKATIQRNRRKSGVQKGDESHKSEEPREK